MKKIVALVLSLVMVLGLATTAFGAELTGKYDLYKTDATGTTAAYTGMKLVAHDAVAPKDTSSPKDGVLDTTGNVKYLDVLDHTSTGVGFYLVQVASVGDADWVVKYEGKDTVFGYFAEYAADDVVYVGNAVAFNNFGEDCGQVDMEPVEDTDYYFVAGTTATTGVYEAVKFGTGAIQAMVGGELVSMNYVTSAKVAHVPEFTYDKDYDVVAVKCAECGVAAVIYPNFASVPKADKATLNYAMINNGEYYCWTNAVAAPEADTEKVESAETFDAGIAMYVGMSVMAAAGSAVVLKKKD